MYAEIDRMYKDYQAEQILLTDDMKRKREDQIVERKRKLRKSRSNVRFSRRPVSEKTAIH